MTFEVARVGIVASLKEIKIFKQWERDLRIFKGVEESEPEFEFFQIHNQVLLENFLSLKAKV